MWHELNSLTAHHLKRSMARAHCCVIHNSLTIFRVLVSLFSYFLIWRLFLVFRNFLLLLLSHITNRVNSTIKSTPIRTTFSFVQLTEKKPVQLDTKKKPPKCMEINNLQKNNQFESMTITFDGREKEKLKSEWVWSFRVQHILCKHSHLVSHFIVVVGFFSFLLIIFPIEMLSLIFCLTNKFT